MLVWCTIRSRLGHVCPSYGRDRRSEVSTRVEATSAAGGIWTRGPRCFCDSPALAMTLLVRIDVSCLFWVLRSDPAADERELYCGCGQSKGADAWVGLLRFFGVLSSRFVWAVPSEAAHSAPGLIVLQSRSLTSPSPVLFHPVC